MTDAPNTGTVDLEKRLEALLAETSDFGVAYVFVRDLREAITQLREYHTALEARPAMPEREAIAGSFKGIAYCYTHPHETTEFGREPLTEADKRAGWQEIPLYAHPASKIEPSEQALKHAMPLRPEVLAFAQLMECQLRANDHKPGWKGDLPLALVARLEEEAAELHTAVDGWIVDIDENRDVGREAADVANFAMMVADVCGALPTTGDVREAAPDNRVCQICDGGPGNECACYCGFEKWEPGPLLASPPSAHDMREALEIADKLDKLHSNQRPLLSAASKALRALASSPMDAVKAAVEEERKACEQIAAQWIHAASDDRNGTAVLIRDAIRSRGEG